MRDEAALTAAKALIEPTGMKTDSHPDNPLLLMVQGEDDSGAFVSSYWDEETNDDLEFDFADVAVLMADGQVLVAIEAGAEKLRYISGYAHAWNNKGEMVAIHLSSIYDMAKEAFGIEPAEATYMHYKA
jgi:hypothetical protein